MNQLGGSQSHSQVQLLQNQQNQKKEKFKLLSKLGDGAYSKVYKVKRIEDNQNYALKKVSLNNLSDKEKENAINEVRILASIRHENVIAYKEAFFDSKGESLCIVMEYCDNGDLYNKITECIDTKKKQSAQNGG